MLVFVIFAFILPLLTSGSPLDTKYDPTWESLDSRPLPTWFDEAKIGIFIHWGVFSVPSFGSEWFWRSWKDNHSEYLDFMKNYPEGFTYQDFAREFKAEFYNPNEWAELFEKSGAKYVVLTSKHHEGYTLWPSKYSYSWNAQEVGPNRDVLGDLAEAVRSKNLTFGLYHSLYEWFNPLYLADQANDYKTQDFVNFKILPEMKELIEKYKPSVIWSDGDWDAPDSYWNSTDFLAWLYNESPVKDVVVTNDRWGKDTICNHGGYLTCADRYNPGKLQDRKWENAFTIDKQSWGFRRNADIADYYTINELLREVAQTVSCGGNVLINVGPTKEGIITPIYKERLLQLGEWLQLNGEAIYGTSPWKAQNDTLTQGVWYTIKGKDALYAIVLEWPENNMLLLKSATEVIQVPYPIINLLGNDETLNFDISDDGVTTIHFPDKAKQRSQWAWVLKITRA